MKKVYFILMAIGVVLGAVAQNLETVQPQIDLYYDGPSLQDIQSNASQSSVSCNENSIDRLNQNSNFVLYSGLVQYFDIKATNPIKINDFKFRTHSWYTSQSDTVDVYTKSGSYVGSQNSLSNWTYSGLGVLSNTSLSWLGLNMGIVIPKDSIQSFLLIPRGDGGFAIDGNANTNLATQDTINAMNSDLVWGTSRIALKTNLGLNLGSRNPIGEICYSNIVIPCDLSNSFEVSTYAMAMINNDAAKNAIRVKSIATGGYGNLIHQWKVDNGPALNIASNSNEIEFSVWNTPFWLRLEVVDGVLGCLIKDSVFIDPLEILSLKNANTHEKPGFLDPLEEERGVSNQALTLAEGVTSPEMMVKIYPNPSNGVFNVFADGLINVKVYNAVGQEILQVSEFDANNAASIELTGYQTGTYILECVFEGGTIKKRITIL